MIKLEIERDYLAVGLNFRELGGIGKERHIYRTGDPDLLSKEIFSFLRHKSFIYYLLDLRTNQERKFSVEEKGIRMVHFPMYGNKAGENPDNLSTTEYANYYFDILMNNRETIRLLFSFLYTELNFKHFIFGCSFGKDRTGLIAYLIQNLADVSLPDILDDYEKSSNFISIQKHFIRDKWESKMLSEEEYLERIKANRETLLKLGDMLNDRFGNIKNFFADLGFSQLEIEQMKKILSLNAHKEGNNHVERSF